MIYYISISLVIALSSESKLKTSAVIEALTEYAGKRKLVIINISTADAPIPEQPVDTGKKCALLRNKYMKKELGNTKYDMLISIENSIERDPSNDVFRDIDWCDIIIEDKNGNIYSSRTMKIYYLIPHVDRKYYDMAKTKTSEDYEYLEDVFSVTIGSLIHEEFPDIPADNWMNDKRFSNKRGGVVDRKEQISKIISGMLELIGNYKIDINRLKDAIIRVPDFPKYGVVFQDLSNILINQKLKKTYDKFIETVIKK